MIRININQWSQRFKRTLYKKLLTKALNYVIRFNSNNYTQILSINSNQMRQAKRSQIPNNQLEQTCQSIPRSAPKKIGQQTVKRIYEVLTKIPTVTNPHLIQQLYLSHNKISTLEGIQAYVSLKSMNVSYNCLERVQELRRIANPLLLSHVKLKMNPWPYGYEDYAVSIFPQLQTFQDIKLNKKNKQIHHKLRDFISKNMIQYFKKSQIILSHLGQDQFNKENHIARSNINTPTMQSNSNQVTIIKNTIERIKNYYIYPSEEAFRKMSITNLLTISFNIIQIICKSAIYQEKCPNQHFLQTNQRIFETIFKLIILKFSYRHDKTLINQLQKQSINSSQKAKSQLFARLGIFLEDQTPKVQARIAGGATKSPLLINNPAQYIKKISDQPLKDHPMNRLANWQQQSYKSLIPMQKTKWYNFYAKNEECSVDNIYQQLPLFVYCKEYLEVVTGIVLDKASQILMLENTLGRVQNQQINVIMEIPSQDQIELQLSLSDAMSFGKNNLSQEIDGSIPKFKTIDQNPVQSCISKTVDKFKKKYENDTPLNIERYSLYQINLAYKVFCTLKKRVKKHKMKLKD